MKKGVGILLFISVFVLLFGVSFIANNLNTKTGIVSLSPNLSGEVYYIDATSGSDSADGISNNTPWKTINKVNGMTQNPGDSFLFKRGEVWREQLNVNGSGNASEMLVFGAYGDGEKPIFNGADLIIVWSANDSNVWNASVTNAPNLVFFNGVKGVAVAIDQVDSEYEWNWSGNVLRVYSVGSPNTTYTNPGVEASRRNLEVSIIAKDYILVDGIHATKTNNVGIQAFASSGDCDSILLNNVTSSFNWGHGILTTTNDITQRNDNGTIQYSTSYSNGGSGIQVSTRTNNTVVRYTTAYGNGYRITEGTGIGSYNASGLLVEYSTSHSNYGDLSGSGSGFYGDVFGENITYRYNIAYNNSKDGFIVEQGVGAMFYYNIAYNNSRSGFTLYGSDNRSGIHNNSIFNNVAIGNIYGIWIHGDYNSINNSVVGNQIKNNIALNNTNKQLFAEYGGENDGSLGSGNVYTNNAFGLNSSGFIGWGKSTSLNNYSAWESSYGGTTNSIEEYPLFAGFSSRNYSLVSGSPGIDEGVSVGLDRDFYGTSVPQGNGVDVGAFEYVNALTGNSGSTDTGGGDDSGGGSGIITNTNNSSVNTTQDTGSANSNLNSDTSITNSTSGEVDTGSSSSVVYVVILIFIILGIIVIGFVIWYVIQRLK